MPDTLTGRRVAFLLTDGVEQAELTEPWKAVQDAGGTPVLVSLEAGTVQGFEHIDHGDVFDVDQVVADADPASFDALVLPGGVVNADFVRADAGAVAFTKAFFTAGRPVAAICHAAWTLVEADVVAGRTLTSFASLRTDLRNAGATWVDEEVHVDGDLVTSRDPDDLPAFCAALVERIAASSPRPTAA